MRSRGRPSRAFQSRWPTFPAVGPSALRIGARSLSRVSLRCVVFAHSFPARRTIRERMKNGGPGWTPK